MEAKTVTLNGRQINITNAIPLKLKDWKALEKLGITVDQVTSGRVEAMVALFFHVLHRADPTVTMDEVEDLTMDDPVVMTLVESMNTNQAKIDRPFLTSSTSLPENTDGPSAI